MKTCQLDSTPLCLSHTLSYLPVCSDYFPNLELLCTLYPESNAYQSFKLPQFIFLNANNFCNTMLNIYHAQTSYWLPHVLIIITVKAHTVQYLEEYILKWILTDWFLILLLFSVNPWWYDEMWIKSRELCIIWELIRNVEFWKASLMHTIFYYYFWETPWLFSCILNFWKADKTKA